MKYIAHTILAVILITFVGSCKHENKDRDADKPSQIERRAADSIPMRPADKNRGLSKPSKVPELAMNRNSMAKEYYSQAPPLWLKLGNPVSTHANEDKGSIRWLFKSGTSMKELFVGRQKVTSIASGAIELPDSLSRSVLMYALVNPDKTRAIISKGGTTISAGVYAIRDGKVVEDSSEDIPVINFDDERRWNINWESWISNEEIVGTINEEDVSGDMIVRTGLYLYDTSKKELRQIEIPKQEGQIQDPGIGIVAAAPNALLVTNGGKEQVLIIEK